MNPFPILASPHGRCGGPNILFPCRVRFEVLPPFWRKMSGVTAMVGILYARVCGLLQSVFVGSPERRKSAINPATSFG